MLNYKKTQDTLGYMYKSFLGENDAKIFVDIDFSYYTNDKGERKCDQYMFEVLIEDYCDPDVDEVIKVLKKYENKTFSFFNTYNITEDLKIVSQKQYPDISFGKLAVGIMLPSMEFKISDETIKFVFHVMVETLETKE